MKKINFKNNGQPAINDTNLNLMQDNIENELNAKVNTSDLIDLIYPVGSIYMSVNSTNPSVLFGGTWEQIKGRFLLGTGSLESNNNDHFGQVTPNDINAPAGEKGGEAYHKLSINEMPKHSHESKHTGRPLYWDSGLDSVGGLISGNNVQYTWDANTKDTGGDNSHNNIPPYFAVNIWQRTA